jgi:hypothetical protein
LLRLQTQAEIEEEKQTKPPRLSAIAFVHFPCWNLLSPVFDVFTPEKKREGIDFISFMFPQCPKA